MLFYLRTKPTPSSKVHRDSCILLRIAGFTCVFEKPFLPHVAHPVDPYECLILVLIVLHFPFRMRYVAAYMLGVLSGKEPGSADIEKILSSVGIEVDESKLSKVLSELKGKNIDELISSGTYINS